MLTNNNKKNLLNFWRTSGALCFKTGHVLFFSFISDDQVDCAILQIMNFIFPVCISLFQNFNSLDLIYTEKSLATLKCHTVQSSLLFFTHLCEEQIKRFISFFFRTLANLLLHLHACSKKSWLETPETRNICRVPLSIFVCTHSTDKSSLLPTSGCKVKILESVKQLFCCLFLKCDILF